ncbi:hypothetical protein DM01DRAFT_1055333 [Hesseltinella vesiculosa]|uniref:Uncharacterized protein n=1 Tax=Hesseltinella vesiculosa TaxID=101127 RepID=A0A1X2GFQ1_9FUNG|nr:hypothetical protein DM01DRAFT_1055333 [Hesseltinella vesiculosa]
MADTPMEEAPLLMDAAQPTAPRLERVMISTRTQPVPNDYANINQVLYQAHMERSDLSIHQDTHSSQYDHMNSILRQAFLERHPAFPE